MRRSIRAVIVALVAASLTATAVAAKTVRLFAVGHKQRLDDAVTYQTFRDKMFAMMDAAYPGRGGLVQSRVDDVASHVRPADPRAPEVALVNFPEDAGLIAGLIGTRGAGARAQTNSALAIAALAGEYLPQRAYYLGRFGATHAVRDSFLSATDTFYRAYYETFRDLASTYGVYVTASANLAPARRVEASENPALVTLLRDPDEPERSYAYEAVSAEVRNVVFIFAPDGEILVPQPDGSTLRSPSETGGVILPSIKKAYLTDLELQLIGLVTTPVRDMDVVDTPAGRIGVVISKDAWMIDVNDRFAAKDAHVLLQSEAFSQWAFQTAEWWPDIFKQGGFGNLQKNPGFLFNIDPSLTGNLFDITFDGQTSLLGKKQKSSPGALSAKNAWVGQNPDTGFLAVAPWLVDDPGIANPRLTLAERRTRLADIGSTLLPGSGLRCPSPIEPGACENGYREGVVWVDAELPEGKDVLLPRDASARVPTAFASNLRVNPPDGGAPSAQKHARIAAKGERLVVVWQDNRHGLPAVYLAASTNGGATFQPAVKVSDNPAGGVAELLPDVALSGGRALIVWQEFVAGEDDDRGRIKLARFSVGGRKLGADVSVDGGHDASGKWRPAIAATGRNVFVAWVDERDTLADGRPLEHIYLARSRNGGRTFGAARRIDQGAPVGLAATLDNKWAPAVAAYGKHVVVTWTDFRNYNWDIFAAASADLGETFGANVRVDDFAPPIERLHQNPTAAIAGRGARTVVAWTDMRAREPDTNIFFAASEDGGKTFSANAQLDRSKTGFDPDRDTPSYQWAVQLAAERDHVCAVWQDDRLGNNDIFFSASRDAGTTFEPDERVDDSGSGPSQQYNPDVAIGRVHGGVTCYVVWEDTRDGDSDIYLAKRRL